MRYKFVLFAAIVLLVVLAYTSLTPESASAEAKKTFSRPTVADILGEPAGK